MPNLLGPALPTGEAFVGLADDPELVGCRKLTALGDAALYSSAALGELWVMHCGELVERERENMRDLGRHAEQQQAGCELWTVIRVS